MLETYHLIPWKSVRQACSELAISKSSVQLILKCSKLSSYCLWRRSRPKCVELPVVLGTMSRKYALSNKVVWTDEATFGLSVSINRFNCACWGPENPHVMAEHYVNLWGVTVWWSSSSIELSRPLDFEATVTGPVYWNLLQQSVKPNIR